MSAEELRHIAMPKLVGAPAYARPTIVVARVARPFNPDDLPLQAVMSDEERELLEHGPVTLPTPADDGEDARLARRTFSLRSLTSRLRRSKG